MAQSRCYCWMLPWLAIYCSLSGMDASSWDRVICSCAAGTQAAGWLTSIWRTCQVAWHISIATYYAVKTIFQAYASRRHIVLPEKDSRSKGDIARLSAPSVNARWHIKAIRSSRRLGSALTHKRITDLRRHSVGWCH